MGNLSKFVEEMASKNGPEIPPIECDSESLPERVSWKSPVFGELTAGPVLSQDLNTFTLKHPLTGEVVTLSNEWLVSLDERSAVLEYDGGMPRDEADRAAKIEFFQLFRKGGRP